MKRVKHFLLASCLFPALLGAQEMANANFWNLLRMPNRQVWQVQD